jgi:hypothetical protein
MRLLSRSFAPGSVSTWIYTRSAPCPWLERAGYRIAMIEMRMGRWIDLYLTAIIHLEADPARIINADDGP